MAKVPLEGPFQTLYTSKVTFTESALLTMAPSGRSIPTTFPENTDVADERESTGEGFKAQEQA
jgi:hypothetical protein